MNARQKAITVFELTKGFTPGQRANASNNFNTMEEMAGYVLELTQSNAELIAALKSLNEWISPESVYWGSKLNQTVESLISKHKAQ